MPWSQDKFKELLTSWVVASDQPFTEVENPEFVEMLSYVCSSATPLEIPGRNSVKRSVMKMADEGIKETKKMFAVG